MLAAIGRTVNFLNLYCLQQQHGASYELPSKDFVDPEDLTFAVGTETLNNRNDNNEPPHMLVVKLGCPIIILRNLSRASRNGTRAILTDVLATEQGYIRTLRCRILTGKPADIGRLVLLPRIPFVHEKEASNFIKWTRLQFPCKVAYVISLNKSQGQTSNTVDIVLADFSTDQQCMPEPNVDALGTLEVHPSECFSHGQLYTGSSRSGDPVGVRYHLHPDAFNTKQTDNVVYGEALVGRRVPVEASVDEHLADPSPNVPEDPIGGRPVDEMSSSDEWDGHAPLDGWADDDFSTGGHQFCGCIDTANDALQNGWFDGSVDGQLDDDAQRYPADCVALGRHSPSMWDGCARLSVPMQHHYESYEFSSSDFAAFGPAWSTCTHSTPANGSDFDSYSAAVDPDYLPSVHDVLAYNANVDSDNSAAAFASLPFTLHDEALNRLEERVWQQLEDEHR